MWVNCYHNVNDISLNNTCPLFPSTRHKLQTMHCLICRTSHSSWTSQSPLAAPAKLQSLSFTIPLTDRNTRIILLMSLHRTSLFKASRGTRTPPSSSLGTETAVLETPEAGSDGRDASLFDLSDISFELDVTEAPLAAPAKLQSLSLTVPLRHKNTCIILLMSLHRTSLFKACRGTRTPPSSSLGTETAVLETPEAGSDGRDASLFDLSDISFELDVTEAPLA